ncbi:MAG: hypothetical protein AABY22_30370 [Nanoarchaeota archaeon]
MNINNQSASCSHNHCFCTKNTGNITMCCRCLTVLLDKKIYLSDCKVSFIMHTVYRNINELGAKGCQMMMV